jgi:hypothetical protein
VPYKEKNKQVIFCLARGYKNKEIYKYRKLVLRNLLLKINMKRYKSNWDYLIFHEGNIEKSHQIIIKLFSLNFSIEFISVESDFKLPDFVNQIEVKELGYVLMCRFYSYQVWKYLKEYEIAIRADDDIFILNLNPVLKNRVFDCDQISEDTHVPTNLIFPKYLKTIGLELAYDHKFPYTNFFITKTDFWLEPRVQDLISQIISNPNSVSNRWGDLPILGVVLNYLKDKNENFLRNDITYYHFSHRATIKNGSRFPGFHLNLFKKN